LISLSSYQPKGPAASFSLCHLLLTILALGNGFVGRKKLAADVGVGEGAMRTIIGRLKSSGLISTLAAGCSLTPSGLELFNQIRDSMEFFEPPSNLPISGLSVGLLLRYASDKITNGLDERDQAVREGAKGALVLAYDGRRLVMPGLTDLSKEHPEMAADLCSRLTLREGDVILIVWADTYAKARCAALDTGIGILTKPKK
jgi:hypothetical protein